jgi:hypothetical protein
MLRPRGSVPSTLAQPCASVNGGWLLLSRSMRVADQHRPEHRGQEHQAEDNCGQCCDPVVDQ